MPDLIREHQDTILKGTTQQWWRVGPLQLTLEVKSEINPHFKRFDEPECFIPYNRIVERGGEYDNPDENFPKFTVLCEEHGIPFLIEHTDWSQHHFYIPASCKMQVLEALEAKVAAEGL
jgi:hypothetical protein